MHRTVLAKSAVTEEGVLECFASIFDVPDLGNGYAKDIVRKGAFARTIREAKARVRSGQSKYLWPMVWGHNNESLPCGGWTDAEEQSKGLFCKGKIILDTAIGKDLYTLCKERLVTAMSFQYNIADGGAFYNKDGFRELLDLDVYAIDPVQYGMHPDALITAVKGRNMNRYKGVAGVGPSRIIEMAQALRTAAEELDFESVKQIAQELYDWGTMSEEDYMDLLVQGSVSGGQFWAEQPRSLPASLTEGTGKSSSSEGGRARLHRVFNELSGKAGKTVHVPTRQRSAGLDGGAPSGAELEMALGALRAARLKSKGDW